MLDMVRTTLNKLLGWCCAFNGAAEILVSAVVGWSVCLVLHWMAIITWSVPPAQGSMTSISGVRDTTGIMQRRLIENIQNRVWSPFAVCFPRACRGLGQKNALSTA